MSLFRIAWRSIQQRGLASLLTTLSMALGVMMVVAVLSVHGVVSRSFRNNSSLGYNLIVGAKGGKLQLTLNTVYYLSQPIENVPYDFFLEFYPAERRQREFENSVQAAVQQTRWEATDALALAGGSSGCGLGNLGALLVHGSLAATEAQQFEQDRQRDGKYAQFTQFAIPLCLGDYYGPFRVIGTTPEMFELLTFGPAADRQFEFAAGRNFQHHSAEHGYFEAVLGSTVAREMGLQLGDQISPTHGDPEAGEQHSDLFTVVGILELSGTPNDRAVFINMEGFFLMGGHAKPLEEEPAGGGGLFPAADAAAGAADAADEPPPLDEAALQQQPLPVEQREVTAVLVRTSHEIFGRILANLINEGRDGQCVEPIREITILFNEFVGPVQLALLVVTALICVVSGISILVSIYNSMSDRKHEIAVMRALGANRGTVMTVILLEAVILSIGGGLLGWASAHALNAAASPQIEARTGVSIGFWDMGEWYWYDLRAQSARPAPLRPLAELGWQAPWLAGWAALAVGSLIVSWKALKAHGAAAAAIVLLLPPGLWVYMAWFWNRSRPARWGTGLHLVGVALVLLYALFHFGIPLNIELALIPALICLAIVVGFLPALAAYRTDVAESLGT